MFFSPASFRPVRRLLLSLLPCLLIVLSMLVSQVAAQTSAAGEVDPSFQEAPLIGLEGDVNRIAVQADGKIIVMGNFTSINGVFRNGIARLNADGTLDTAFDPSTNVRGKVYIVAPQADGKILFGSYVNNPDDSVDHHMVRLNADGSLDAAFALYTHVPVIALTIQADGKMLLIHPHSNVVRINPDGTLDPTFDSAVYSAYAMVLQADGKILIGHDSGIARLNSNGSIDATFASSANGPVSALALQADSKIVVGGSFTTINGAARNRIARINADGSLDATFAPAGGADSSVSALMLQADGKLVISGNFTMVNGVGRKRIARLNGDGSIDSTFAPNAEDVYAFALQADDKILLGGSFTTVNNMRRVYIARLNADSSPDTTFLASINSGSTIWAIAVQPDGKMVVGGDFRIVTDTGHRYQNIARLNTDGSLDSTYALGSGTNGRVHALVLQSDGKLLIGGYFTTINGVSRNGFARLNADGSLDPTFAQSAHTVSAILPQADGKIFIGGGFTDVNGASLGGIARLNADGSLDPTFTRHIGGSVHAIAVQANGKVLVGGSFSYNAYGVDYKSITRLNPNASHDSTFASSISGNYVSAIALQADGKMLVGGSFSYSGGNNIARLNANGSIDTTFVSKGGYYDWMPEYSDSVRAIAVQPYGKILIGGNFTTVNWVSRNGFARLNADGSLDSTFAATGGANGSVNALALQADGKILAGGKFVTVNGVLRTSLARLDGSVTPPTPTSTPVMTATPTNALPTNTPMTTATPPPTSTAAPTTTATTTATTTPSPSPASPTPTPSGPRLFLSPSTTALGQGQIVQLTLQVDTAGSVADTVDAYLSYDPALLEVIDASGNPATSIMPGAALAGNVTYNKVDAATGTIGFSASRYESPYFTGSATAATIRFRAKAPTNSTQVQLVRSGIRQSDLFEGGTRLQAALGHATVQIANGPLLHGRIAVEKRGPAGTSRWITPLLRTDGATTTGGITLYQPGTTTEVGRFAATTDADGRFSVALTNVPVGTYDIRVKGDNTLSNQRAGINLQSPTEIDFGTLRVGDGTGDDGVTGADVSYIIPSFLLSSGEAGFRPYADTNKDDGITGADVSALVPNFLHEGPIAVTGAAKPEPQEMRAQSGTPQITLRPAREKVQVGEIIPVELKVELGATAADTVDLHVNIDPALLEIVDASGQPVRSLQVNRSAFGDVIYNRVDAANGQISLSASRLTGPAASGSLTVATFFVRATQRFTTTPLTLATSGTRRADVFAQGQSLQPTLSGRVLTMGDVYRTFIPRASH